MHHVITDLGGGDPSIWAAIPRERAVRWTGVFIRLRPVWPGAGAMHVIDRAHRGGVPAGVREWAHRARRAEAIGLTPERYAALFASLDRIPPAEAASHPDHDLDLTRPLHPTRRFDDALWAPWCGLVDDGVPEDDATRLLLTACDAQRAVEDDVR